MRARVSSLLGVLLLLIVGTAAAQDPTLLISPDVIPIGSAFNVTASGLKPNTTYTFAIVEAANEESVFETESTSNATGRIALNLTTDPETDQPGTYRIELREGEDVVIGEEFELQNAEQPVPTPATDNPLAVGDANLNIFPTEGVVGTAFEILVTKLAPGDSAEIIVRDPGGNEVYSTMRTVSDDGSVEVNIFSETTDVPGVYTVIVRNQAHTYEANFELTALGGRDGEVTITPQTEDGKPSYLIEVVNVQPFADLTVRVKAPDSSTPLFEGRVRASVEGKALVEFAPEVGTAAGTYDVVVLDREAEVGTATLTLDEAAVALLGGAVIRISPASGKPGTLRLITVSGLDASETVTIEIADATGVVSTQEKTADVNGTVALGLREIGDNRVGDYTVRVLRGETVIATSDLVIAAAEEPAADVNITITPQSATVGESHEVLIEGLAAGETVTVNVTFDGASVYTVDKTADDAGVVTLRLSTNASDPTGTYTVNVARGDDTLASADLDVIESEAQPEATLEASSTPSATITVDPESGPQGTQHIIRIEGLPADVTVSIDLSLDDRVVFSTEKTASADGTLEFSIETEEGDAPGEYTIDVRQGDVSFGSATLTIEGEDAEATPTPTAEPTAEATVEPSATPEATDDVSLSIDPTSGPRGTSHLLTVTGLDAGETITYDVIFDGASILTGEATADDAGTAVFQLNSEETDPLGDYTIEIRRNDELVTSGTLTIAEAGSEATPTPAPDVDAEVAIEPASGVAGTSHEVVVTGLAENEDVVVQVEFDGEEVYSTTKTASAEGEVTLTLSTSDEDELGVYTVNVLTGDEVVASADLELTAAESENTGPEGTEAETNENTGPEGTEAETNENTGPEGTEAETATANVPQGTVVLDVTDVLEDEALEYTFEGEEGDHIIAMLSSEDFDSYLSLLGPDGYELAYNDDYNGLDAQIGPVTLPTTGEYTLVVSSYNTYEDLPSSGEFTLQVQSVTLDEIAAGVPQRLTFSDETHMYYFSFEGSVGDVIDILVTSPEGTDTTLSLSDASGIVVATDDDSGAGYDPEIYQYLLSTEGTYTIVVSTTDNAGTADLVLTQESAASLNDGVQQVDLTPKLSSRSLTYEATEGETVLLNVSVASGDPIDMTITAYQGDFTLMTYSAGSIPDGTVLGFEVPEDGQVDVFITGTNLGAVTVELSVEP